MGEEVDDIMDRPDEGADRLARGQESRDMEEVGEDEHRDRLGPLIRIRPAGSTG